eukprot:TRINITY_DN8134_c0_g2_i1.p2 TRINITY_DN8134_c0_g2~~TRINITY_DN8134_c0_g2_i1.p2  ORF type:complete len:217 (-),score=31.17 TRINITY_DN8134_c0_g2_i1:677-1327(-)
MAKDDVRCSQYHLIKCAAKKTLILNFYANSADKIVEILMSDDLQLRRIGEVGSARYPINRADFFEQANNLQAIIASLTLGDKTRGSTLSDLMMTNNKKLAASSKNEPLSISAKNSAKKENAGAPYKGGSSMTYDQGKHNTSNTIMGRGFFNNENINQPLLSLAKLNGGGYQGYSGLSLQGGGRAIEKRPGFSGVYWDNSKNHLEQNLKNLIKSEDI